jgi:Cft2 family RNA processing exonuclease
MSPKPRLLFAHCVINDAVVKFVDLGTGEGIGANCQLLEIGPFRIVIDAGMNPREVGAASLPRLDLIGAAPDAVILTHCHLDHLGALPLLARMFDSVPFLMSQPSAMLAPRMLHNSVSVMMRQRGELPASADLPLYTHGEVERMFARALPMKYAATRFLDKDGETLEITLHQAGHVAGAASVELKWRRERIMHTGDILFDAQRHVGGAKPPSGPFSVLITETTRGAASRMESHDRDSETLRFLETVDRTIRGRGAVLIPVFALGRAQEMFCILHESRKLLPKCPIFGAGLGLDIAERFDEITRKTGLLHFRDTVLRDLNVKVLESDLRPGRAPKCGIYVLSSGMMTESTPSYKAAASILYDPASTVCIVGYCDPDTPGGHLMRTEKGGAFTFETLDYKTELHASVERFDLSGHADREQLLDYAVKSNPANVLLVHGEPDARAWFRDNLSADLPHSNVLIPALAHEYSL